MHFSRFSDRISKFIYHYIFFLCSKKEKNSHCMLWILKLLEFATVFIYVLCHIYKDFCYRVTKPLLNGKISMSWYFNNDTFFLQFSQQFWHFSAAFMLQPQLHSFYFVCFLLKEKLNFLLKNMLTCYLH